MAIGLSLPNTVGLLICISQYQILDAVLGLVGIATAPITGKYRCDTPHRELLSWIRPHVEM